MEKLFLLASAQSGSVEVNGDVWTFDPAVSGPSGEFVADGNERTLDLGRPGGLRATLAPDTSPPMPDPAGFASPPTALGPATVRMEAQVGSENLITVTLTNGTGADLKLGAFHFDFGGFDAGPRDFQLVYLSGDLAVAAGTEIGRGSRGAGSSNNTNYADFDLPLAPALSDTTLAPGQSASFRLVFGNATSETTASGVDNIAITTTAPGGPDRDGDGIPDADETLLNLNPDNPADAALDRDGDGNVWCRDWRMAP